MTINDTLQDNAQQKARAVILSRLLRGNADSTDMHFILKDAGVGGDFQPVVAGLIRDGYVRKNEKVVPSVYSLTWRYYFTSVFTHCP